MVPGELVQGDAPFFGHGQVHGQNDGRRGVDGHGNRHLVQRDFGEQELHVGQGVDGHADLAHLAFAQGVVRIQADLGGQVEGHAQAGLPLLQQVAVAAVGFLGRAEAGVLAHGPELAAVHGRLHAAGVGVSAGIAQVFFIVEPLHVLGIVEALHRKRSGLEDFPCAPCFCPAFFFKMRSSHSFFFMVENLLLKSKKDLS